MLLIIFLGLIGNSALFCDGCDVGTKFVKKFDWNKVGISLLIGFLKKRVFKTAACVIQVFYLWFH